jgi:hypothetical protein
MQGVKNLWNGRSLNCSDVKKKLFYCRFRMDANHRKMGRSPLHLEYYILKRKETCECYATFRQQKRPANGRAFPGF